MTTRRLPSIEHESSSPLADRIEALKALVPEATSEDGIDFDALADLLGKSEDRNEKYNFSWWGKQEAMRSLSQPSQASLKPAPEESVNWNDTGNLFIEGENLEALKLLHKSYAGRVKMIYIDPPYNTGNDYVYSDNYSDPLDQYLRETGQVDENGNYQTSKPEKNGRKHSKWLTMMYPRLALARQLLRDDGVIFVSIDDNEVHHLRLLMNMVFGEENFCGTFVWERKKKPSFLDRNMGTVTEYILAYAKILQLSPQFIDGEVEDGKQYPFNNAGNPMKTLVFPPGSVMFNLEDQIVKAQDMSGGNIRTELLDDVEIVSRRNADKFRLRGEWRYSQSKVDAFVSQRSEIVISRIPFRPNYINRERNVKKTINLLSYRVNNIPTNEDATQELREIFAQDVIDYPKPTGLISHLVSAILPPPPRTSVLTLKSCWISSLAARLLLTRSWRRTARMAAIVASSWCSCRSQWIIPNTLISLRSARNVFAASSRECAKKKRARTKTWASAFSSWINHPADNGKTYPQIPAPKPISASLNY